MQWGIRVHGYIVTDPSWTCVADVMGSTHGHGRTRVIGDLIRRPTPRAPWETVLTADTPERTL